MYIYIYIYIYLRNVCEREGKGCEVWPEFVLCISPIQLHTHKRQIFMYTCTPHNTSCALAVLRTYNGHCVRMRMSVKSSGTQGVPFIIFTFRRLLASAPFVYVPSIRTSAEPALGRAPQQTCTRQSKRHYVTKVQDSKEDREGLGCHLGHGHHEHTWSSEQPYCCGARGAVGGSVPFLKGLTSVVVLRVEKVILFIHSSHLQSLLVPKLEPATFGLQVRLSNHKAMTAMIYIIFIYKI